VFIVNITIDDRLLFGNICVDFGFLVIFLIINPLYQPDIQLEINIAIFTPKAYNRDLAEIPFEISSALVELI
jgi:hypothetical protein